VTWRARINLDIGLTDREEAGRVLAEILRSIEQMRSVNASPPFPYTAKVGTFHRVTGYTLTEREERER
jgi:hypothetical protein